jgi:DNA-binding NarL/FixJ family response regulator
MISQQGVASAAKKARIFLVDDHPIVRQGLSQLVNQESDLVMCGHAEDARSAMEAIAASRPDLIIVDISLAGPDGLDLLKQVRLTDPALPVLILSMLDESLYADRALRAGANGYIMKQEATENVLIAVRRILHGEIYVSDRMASRMLAQFASHPDAAKRSPIDLLTDRELEVFRLIGQGQGTRQIAENLCLSVKTVESYQAHIKDKLLLKNSRELIQRAIQWVADQRTS